MFWTMTFTMTVEYNPCEFLAFFEKMHIQCCRWKCKWLQKDADGWAWTSCCWGALSQKWGTTCSLPYPLWQCWLETSNKMKASSWSGRLLSLWKSVHCFLFRSNFFTCVKKRSNWGRSLNWFLGTLGLNLWVE